MEKISLSFAKRFCIKRPQKCARYLMDLLVCLHLTSKATFMGLDFFSSFILVWFCLAIYVVQKRAPYLDDLRRP